MKKLITIIVLAIVSANTYGQYITPVGTAQWFKKNVYFGSDTANANAVIRTNGKVGIGLSNPNYTLDVYGSWANTYENAGKKYLFLSDSFAHGIAVQDVATSVFESQVVVDPNFVLLKNSIGTDMNRAFFSVYNEDNLIMGFGNISLHNKSNTIRFDTTSKSVVGIDTSPYTPNMHWVDSSYTVRATMSNSGYLKLGAETLPTTALDVAGTVKIDSSLVLAGDFFTLSDSVFTIPDAVSTVIIDANTGFAAATITMPAHPYYGQIVSIAVGSNGIGTLTVLPNSGQSVAAGTPVLHSGSISYRYRGANSTWYRW